MGNPSTLLYLVLVVNERNGHVQVKVQPGGYSVHVGLETQERLTLAWGRLGEPPEVILHFDP